MSRTKEIEIRIIVVERPGDFQAYQEGYPELWEFGYSPSQAIENVAKYRLNSPVQQSYIFRTNIVPDFETLPL